MCAYTRVYISLPPSLPSSLSLSIYIYILIFINIYLDVCIYTCVYIHTDKETPTHTHFERHLTVCLINFSKKKKREFIEGYRLANMIFRRAWEPGIENKQHLRVPRLLWSQPQKQSSEDTAAGANTGYLLEAVWMCHNWTLTALTASSRPLLLCKPPHSFCIFTWQHSYLKGK